MPSPEFVHVGDPPLKGDVGILRSLRQLVDEIVHPALLVGFGLCLGLKTGDFGKVRHDEPVDFDTKPESPVWIRPLSCWHVSSPSEYEGPPRPAARAYPL